MTASRDFWIACSKQNVIDIQGFYMTLVHSYYNSITFHYFHITLQYSIQRRRTVQKSGGGGSNVVGIMAPLVGIGLTDLPKTGGTIAPIASPPPLVRHI